MKEELNLETRLHIPEVVVKTPDPVEVITSSPPEFPRDILEAVSALNTKAEKKGETRLQGRQITTAVVSCRDTYEHYFVKGYRRAKNITQATLRGISLQDYVQQSCNHSCRICMENLHEEQGRLETSQAGIANIPHVRSIEMPGRELLLCDLARLGIIRAPEKLTGNLRTLPVPILRALGIDIKKLPSYYTPIQKRQLEFFDAGFKILWQVSAFFQNEVETHVVTASFE